MDLKKRSDYQIYQVGKWFWIPVLLLLFIFSYWGYDNYIKDKYFCVFNSLTGIPCPGCGGTRAVLALAKGHLTDSFFYHPSVIFFFIEYIHFMSRMYYKIHINTDKIDRKINIERYVYAFVFVLILQWILKIVIILL